MAEAAVAERKLSKKEVMRYATEQLHAVRPQPAGIATMLAALSNSIDDADEAAKAASVEGPPKDVAEAISRIDAAVGKLEHPPKAKPNLKEMADSPSLAVTTEATSKGAKLAKG